MKMVRLVLRPGHPSGKMCVLLADGKDVDVTAQGVVISEDQVTEDIQGPLAKWVAVKSAAAGDPDEQELAAQRAHLEAMTMKQLREVAKPLGVDVKDTKKSELIDEILAASK